MSVWASFKEGLLTAAQWAAKHLLAPLCAVLLILGGILLVSMGFKGLQIGGLLGKLFGKGEPEKKTVEIANTVDPDRVDKDGRVIQPGQPDSQGITQAVVVPIEEPGLLSDPKTVKFIPPGETKPVVVPLPDGVTSKDVDQVIVVQPEVYAVTVKDKSGLSPATVDELLKKYKK